MTVARHGSLVIDPVHYEILWLGRDETRLLSAFPDVYIAEDPEWRVVAGYLMVSHSSGDPKEDRLEIASHGRRVCEMSEAEEGSITLTFDTPPQLSGQVLRSRAGLAVVPDRSTTIALSSGHGFTVRLTSPTKEHLGFTLVHGPAAGKVDNRIKLLQSLRRLKGDHG